LRLCFLADGTNFLKHKNLGPTHAWTRFSWELVEGVHLIIYVWVVISLVLLLNLHLKLRSQTELIRIVAREIVLTNARRAERTQSTRLPSTAQ
jgi:hypothetical protein